ncbi:hypothetical protein [Sinorhizobium medicae]|uniref:hypothetical protein n=1 Tax=Sinorhizobium medicae TaxID=110321 RepID=UPI0012966813|nr:hypothetical protein [Sinorhizobium medicae]MQV46328.1 hypothetical protein [Sinorhizobium medicae]MQV54059.1 hypothetical protein [Sinorhizobium medicae]MQV71698.1 hypothetical protein [Sinorhizobium medicae]
MARQTNASQARRLLALASIYDGGSRADAARLGSVMVQIVTHRPHGAAGHFREGHSEPSGHARLAQLLEIELGRILVQSSGGAMGQSPRSLRPAAAGRAQGCG